MAIRGDVMKMSEAKKDKPACNKGKHRVYREDGTYYMSF